MTIRRFDKGPCYMEECDDGTWVRYADHATALAAMTERAERAEADRDAQAEAVRNAGCFFCRDCDAVRCEEGVASKLRKIAEQSGKRNWWNVVIYVIELHRMVLDAMRRDMNNPIAAAAVKGEQARLCYPFAMTTCDDPKCACRDQKRDAVEGGKP